MKLKQKVCIACINGTEEKWIKEDENWWKKGFVLCPWRDDCNFNVRIKFVKDASKVQHITSRWKIGINKLRDDCRCKLEHMLFDRDRGKDGNIQLVSLKKEESEDGR